MPKRRGWPRTESWAVHLLTASGAAFAVLATLSAFESNWTATFAWLGAALFVDGIDGPLARTFKVEERVPWFDGAILDLVIDYATYVFIPALMLARADIMPPLLAIPAAIAVAVIGAIYFADTRMKTVDFGFRGFPAVWNAVVFVLVAFALPPYAGAALIALFLVLTFTPVEFIHPFRVRQARPLTLTMTLAWAVFALLAVLADLKPSAAILWGLGISSAYLALIGAFLQAARLWRRRSASSA
ncbi:phosphatidylcholine synthase [Kaistia algarum]|uniref:CDP-alcohol phosphatidyltransferase family protein n=1 Tax=Kaistia algarum TaxID=2083279 RepID=UPI000CE8AC9B|nr:CDP-alcohol phosphatidyltransferase family protein [Kaistia algarum]MCX5514831.1 phosphatidylcholine synthase [Kaistia algarum]PPE79590.1 phosphatidylcholine synthase [Kaistia algarum]